MALLKLLTLSTITMLTLPMAANAAGSKAIKDDSGRFTIAGDIPSSQSKLLLQDFKYMHMMALRSNDPELKRVMEIGEANSVSLSQWLADRVQVVISESTDLEKALVPVQANYPFENPGVLPDQERPIAEPSPTEGDESKPARKGVVVMSNMGAAIYHFGKTKGILVGMKIPGGEQVNLSSPRSGVIMIGEGHFMPLLRKFGLKDENINTEVYSLFRLSTMFHEARHSDGNGKSLSFMHALCPTDHDFANVNACDRNLNGPYTVGALMARAFIAQCVSCSVAEKEALKLEALDSFNRVIKESVKSASSTDSTMQRVCDSLRDVNRRLSDPIPLPDFCTAPASPSGEVVKSTFWDARPEGRR